MKLDRQTREATVVLGFLAALAVNLVAVTLGMQDRVLLRMRDDSRNRITVAAPVTPP